MNPRRYPFRSPNHIYLLSLRHNIISDPLLGFYAEKVKVRCLTGQKINIFFKIIAIWVYQDLTPKELSQFLSHM